MKLTSRIIAGLLCVVSHSATMVWAADHGDSPGVRLQNRLDINDVYIFQSPANAANTVMIMTTNPASGILSPSTYHPSARYEIAVDSDGDAKPDKIYSATFGRPTTTGVQTVKLRSRTLHGKGKTEVLGQGQTGDTISLSGGGSLRAGVFDDPFFFDLIAFRNGLSFSPTEPRNFFAGLNTNAIVIEVPSTELSEAGDTTIGIWGRTIMGQQVDRMGRPAINTVLVTAANKDKFNSGQPDKDRQKFGADAVNIIVSLGSSNSTAQSLRDTLFPDILTFDTSSSAGFLNGRRLEDDVIDAELNLLSSGGVTTDYVSNDSTFSATFPYLQAKNP